MKQKTKIHFRTSLPAFTLVELLVVISIIAMLLAILMPSLQKARSAAYGIKCGANMRNVGAAMLSYVTDYGKYPFSYAYASDNKGGYDLNNQTTDNGNGYVHWSYFLTEGGRCKDDAFKCPGMLRGGAPRTNPGSNKNDWEAGQVDGQGQNQPNNIVDKQATRMSIAANAAIIPRNKFNAAAFGIRKANRLVGASEVDRPSEVILATEFTNNWKAITGDGMLKSKSHRSVTPFTDLSAGTDIYNGSGYFIYGLGQQTQNFGLSPVSQIMNAVGLIQDSPINAIGRHHSGSGETKEMGGCANFLYCDGHVERQTVLDTFKTFKWGKKFYSLTGSNSVLLNR